MLLMKRLRAALSHPLAFVVCLVVAAVPGCDDASDAPKDAGPHDAQVPIRSPDGGNSLDAGAHDAEAPGNCGSTGDGPAVEGCSCNRPATIFYCCWSGSGQGATCRQGKWSRFVDGPCGGRQSPTDAAVSMVEVKAEGIECR
jgi:hypothetical protein